MTRLAVAVGAVVLLRLVIGLQGGAPHIFPDEIGYVAAARGVVTEPSFSLGPAPLYYPLYSLVVSPLFAFDLGSSALFAGVMVLNAVLGGATAAAVYLAARRLLGASSGPAGWAALIVGVFPGQSLFTASIWAENLLPLTIIGWLLAVHWIFQRVTVGRAAIVVASALACYWTHPRSVVVIAVTAGIGILMVVRRRAGPSTVGPSVLLGAGALVGYVVSRELVGRVLGAFYEGSSISLQVGGSLSRILSPGRWDDIVVRLVGVAWYQVVSTGGLIVLGVWALCSRARPLVGRDRRVSPETASAATAIVLLAVLLGLGVGAAAFLSNGERADNFFAGRYVDAATPLVVAAGVVWLLQSQAVPQLTRRFGAAALTLAGLTVVLRVAAPALGDPRPFVGDMSLGLVGHISIVGGRRVLAMATIGLLTLGLVWATARRRPTAAVAVAAIVFASLGLIGRHGELSRPFALSASLQAFADDAAELSRGAPVGMDLTYAAASDVGMLGYQWFRPELRIYDLPDDVDPRSPWAIGPLRSDGLLRRGGQLVLLDPSRALGLYVLPGPEQDGLRQRGALLQPDFPAVLPSTSAQSTVAGASELWVEFGDTAELTLSVSHRGTTGRWARFDPNGAGFSQGRIRVGARMSPAVAGQSADRPWFADLPTDLLPGQQVSVVVDLSTGGDAGPDLAPGEYVLDADLYQEGVGWFAERYGQVAHTVRLIVAEAR